MWLILFIPVVIVPVVFFICNEFIKDKYLAGWTGFLVSVVVNALLIIKLTAIFAQ